MNGILVSSAGATLFAEGSLRTWLVSNSGVSTLFVVAGALLMVVVAVFVWAAFFRKPGRRRSHHRHRHREKSEAPAPPPGPESQPHLRRHRRRKRKRMPNPTLAETGGLPPARPPGSGPPSI